MGRKYSIDLLRIISALAVITIHVITGPVYNYRGTLDREFLSTLYCIQNMMKWSVPVFFMITGYCILRKDEYTYQQCFRHAIKYVWILATVGLFYAMLEQVADKRTVNVQVLIDSAKNVIAGRLWDHMWYIYEIIGIYLVMPVIHKFIQSGKQNCLYLTSLLFVFSIMVPFVDEWMKIGFSVPLGGYLFFVCFGGAVARNAFGRKIKFGIILTAFFAVVWILLSDHNVSFNYHSVPVCLIAAGIFLVAVDVDIRPSRFMETLSMCTWGVYLIHPFFINVAVKLLHIDLFSQAPWFRLIGFWLVISCISFVVTYVLRKIPVIQKLF